MNNARVMPRLSIPAFLLYSLASVISVPTAFLNTDTELITLLTLGVIITAVSGLIAWLMFRITGDWGKQPGTKFGVFLIQVCAIGALRGLALYMLTPVFGLEQPTTLAFRVTNSMLVTLIWLTLAAAAITSQRAYRDKYRTLVNQAVFTTARGEVTGEERSPIALDELENIAALKSNLAAIHSHLAQSGVSSESLTNAAASVRAEIEETLRPMSHRLWFDARDGSPRVRLRGLLVDALTELRYSTARVIFVCVVPALIGGMVFLPLTTNLIAVILSTLVLLVLLSSYRLIKLNRADKLWANSVFITVIGVVFGAVYLSCLAVSLPAAAVAYSGMAWVFPLTVWLVMWADSTVMMVSQDRHTLSQALQSRQDRAVNTARPEQVRLASYLHNSLQSELTGIAYQLENSAKNADSVEARRSLEQLGSLINRSISQDFTNFTETPSSRIKRIIDAWSGIAEVTIESHGIITEADPRHVLAIQVIEEGITNAVRHSGANEIRVSLREVGHNLEIELSSNKPASSTPGEGVGTVWLEHFSIEQHMLRTVNGRSVLTVVL